MPIFIHVHRSTKACVLLARIISKLAGSRYEARYHSSLRKGGNSLHSASHAFGCLSYWNLGNLCRIEKSVVQKSRSARTVSNQTRRTYDTYLGTEKESDLADAA